MKSCSLYALGLDPYEILAIVTAFFPETVKRFFELNDNPRREEIEQFIAKNFGKKSSGSLDIPEIELNMDFLSLTDTVNKMAKDPACPNNMRNRMYGKKHKVILRLFYKNRVDRVEKQGDYWLISVDGGRHLYHQLAEMLPESVIKGMPVTEGEKYERQGGYEPYDPAVFNKWLAYYVYFMHDLLSDVK